MDGKQQKNPSQQQIVKLSNSQEESEEEDDSFDRETLKNKFVSAWNNVKYGKFEDNEHVF